MNLTPGRIIPIREAGTVDAPLLAPLMRAAFRDVAEHYGLTPDNCPNYPSNCTREWILGDRERGAAYSLLEATERPLGCAALEGAGKGRCYLERLAVLPSERRQGYGQALDRQVLNEALSRGFSTVQIGIMDADAGLKIWYERLGFLQIGTRSLAHLPFVVAFIQHSLKDSP